MNENDLKYYIREFLSSINIINFEEILRQSVENIIKDVWKDAWEEAWEEGYDVGYDEGVKTGEI